MSCVAYKKGIETIFDSENVEKRAHRVRSVDFPDRPCYHQTVINLYVNSQW